jgi:CheY-like chemotaxis protein
VVNEPRVLIVDDEAAVRGLLRVIAQRCGLTADEAADGCECIELLERSDYDVILLDLAMPWLNGLDVIEYLKRKELTPAVIVLTAMTRWSFSGIDPEIVHCILRKPCDVDLLAAMLSAAANAMFERRKAKATHSAGVRSAESARFVWAAVPTREGA